MASYRDLTSEGTMVGAHMSHYRILEKLGEGGMGVVYRAEDTRLKRTVALKFLPPELTKDDTAKQRFIQEAQAASTLQHANICTVHDIDETEDGQLFIVMDYYEGESLKNVLADRRLTIAESVNYASQIAQGLSKAHERGIVHRDIKPGNIIVMTDGTVRIVDFGLAKLSGQSALTKEGTTIGTAAYMSPEQARGEQVDQRTDVWSLGVILYEMITGRRPFLGDHDAAVLYAITNVSPPRPASLRSDITARLEGIVLKMLEKDPVVRYQTATEVVNDLASLQGESPVLLIKRVVRQIARRKHAWLVLTGTSLVVVVLVLWAGGILQHWFGSPHVSGSQYIGVLPFVSIGGDSSRQLLCDGLFERIVGGLAESHAYLQGSEICPASETRKYKNAREVRDGSGVTVAVESSLEWLPGEIRVTVTLVDTKNLSSIDSRKLNVPAARASDLEAALLSSILEMFETRPTSAAIIRSGMNFTKDEKAYGYWLLGRGELLEYTKAQKVSNAIAFFYRSVRADSMFALAHAGLGEAYWRRFGLTKDIQWADSAIAESMQARRLAPDVPEVHFTLGLIYHGTGKDSLAIGEYQSILSRDSLNANVIMELGEAYASSTQKVKAESTYKRALQLRSIDWRSYHYLARFYYRTGRDSDAVAVWKNALLIAPDQPLVLNGLGAVFFLQEEWMKAVDYFSHALQIDSSWYPLYANLGTAYYYDGQYESAVKWYRESLNRNAKNFQVWGGLGAAYRALGSKKLAQEASATAARLAEDQLKINNSDADVLSQLSGYYADLGRKAEARAMVRRALAIAPTNAKLMERAVTTYEQIGNRAQALKWLGEAAKRGAKLTEIRWSPELKELRKDVRYARMKKGGDTRGK